MDGCAWSVEDLESEAAELAQRWPEHVLAPGRVDVVCSPLVDHEEGEIHGYGETGSLPGGIVIHLAHAPSLQVSAWAHELVHAHLYREQGVFDGDHARGEGPWVADYDLAVTRTALRLP